MIIQKNLEFFKNANTPAESKIFSNSSADVLTISVDGDFTEGLFIIEGKNYSGAKWCPLAAINLSDFAIITEGIVKTGLYEMSAIGLREIRVRIETISGNVSIFGQLISTEEV